jgi:hypothetical protein
MKKFTAFVTPILMGIAVNAPALIVRASPMTAPAAIRTENFTANIGVNVHVEYTDGKYANTTNDIADLKYLGIKLARDSNLNPSNAGQGNYGTLAAAGIKFDLIVNGNQTLAQTMSELTTFASAHPGAIASVEGPNEIDHSPISYSGLTGAAAANLLQTNLFSALAKTSLSNLPVYSYSLGSGGTPLSGYTAAALHPYPQNGAQPLSWLQTAMKATPAGHSSVITELGYSSLPTSSIYGVDQTTQAKETLNALLDAAKLGIGTTFLYELLDAYADPTNTLAGNHYGLFNLDNSPKPVAVAIHNMMSILGDTGSTAATFTTSTLNYTLSGAPSTSENLLMEKSTGAFDLVLWNEPTIWNPTTHSEIAVPVTNVGVNLGATYATVEVFDPLQGSTPVEVLHNTSTVSVGLTDHPLFVEVEPGLSTSSLSDDVHYNAGGHVTTQVVHGPNAGTLITTTLGYDSLGNVTSHSAVVDAHALAALGINSSNVTDDGHGDSIITYAGHQSITVFGFSAAQLYDYSGHVI